MRKSSSLTGSLPLRFLKTLNADLINVAFIFSNQTTFTQMQNVDRLNTIPPEKEGFNHDHNGIGRNPGPSGGQNPPPQLLSPTQDCDSQGREGIGEEVLASDPVGGVSGDHQPAKKARFDADYTLDNNNVVYDIILTRILKFQSDFPLKKSETVCAS